MIVRERSGVPAGDILVECGVEEHVFHVGDLGDVPLGNVLVEFLSYIDVLGRHARGDRRFRERRHERLHSQPRSCARVLSRAAGRGPRLAATSTARLRATSPGGRYRCPRTARAWRSALSGTMGRVAPHQITAATCACTLRAAGRGPRLAATSTARLRATKSGSVCIDVLGRHARGDRRSWNDGHAVTAGHVRVYSESGGTWTQVGGDIDGEAAGDNGPGVSVSMSSDGTRVAIGALRTTAERLHSYAGHVRVSLLRAAGRGPSLAPTSDGEAAGYDRLRDELGHRCPLTARDVAHTALHRAHDGVVGNHQRHPSPATCACTLRAAGRGPRLAATSTARLRATRPGGLYRCLRTARVWPSAPQRTTPTAATCACTLRAAGRGPRLAATSTVRMRSTTLGCRYRCPRTGLAWRSAPLRTTASAAPSTISVTCECSLLFATHPSRPPTAPWAHAPTPSRAA